MRRLLGRLVLLLGSTAITIVGLEITLMLFVDVTDNIEYEHLPHVGMRLKPNQQGLLIKDAVKGGDAIRARFHADNVGFNNTRDYSRQRPPGSYRIAIVGDSFVEALEVDCEDAFFSVLERELSEQGLDVEVYSFGASGFGAAQAYHLIKHYVLDYAPDLVSQAHS